MVEEIKENNLEKKDNWEKNQKKDFYIEIILMLILGILIGMAIKTEASKRITIGSDDYKIKFSDDAYNLNKLEKELAKNQEESQKTGTENSQADPVDGASCSVN
jgi:hypothetical protein